MIVALNGATEVGLSTWYREKHFIRYGRGGGWRKACFASFNSVPRVGRTTRGTGCCWSVGYFLCLRLLLPLSGSVLKCSERPFTFPVISNRGPDLLSVIFRSWSPRLPLPLPGSPKFISLFSPLFPLMALLSKFTKPTHNQRRTERTRLTGSETM